MPEYSNASSDYMPAYLNSFKTLQSEDMQQHQIAQDIANQIIAQQREARLGTEEDRRMKLAENAESRQKATAEHQVRQDTEAGRRNDLMMYHNAQNFLTAGGTPIAAMAGLPPQFAKGIEDQAMMPVQGQFNKDAAQFDTDLTQYGTDMADYQKQTALNSFLAQAMGGLMGGAGGAMAATPAGNGAVNTALNEGLEAPTAPTAPVMPDRDTILSTPYKSAKILEDERKQAERERHNKVIEGVRETANANTKLRIENTYNLTKDMNEARQDRYNALNAIGMINANAHAKAAAAAAERAQSYDSMNEFKQQNPGFFSDRKMIFGAIEKQRAPLYRDQTALRSKKTLLERDYNTALGEIQNFLPGFDPNAPNAQQRLNLLLDPNNNNKPGGTSSKAWLKVVPGIVQSISKMQGYKGAMDALDAELKDVGEKLNGVNEDMNRYLLPGEGPQTFFGTAKRGGAAGSGSSGSNGGKASLDDFAKKHGF